jgi:hypothetical protein
MRATWASVCRRTGISGRRGWGLEAGGWRLFARSPGSSRSSYTVFVPSPFESALLNLRLFELRREPVLREARAWFLRDFNPDTFEELVTLLSGERNASFRMVLGYWDMAASLVTTGAIDRDAFLGAHSEVFGTFSKIHPLLAQLRTATNEQNFCRHLEAVVLAAPDAEAILIRRRAALRAAASARQPPSPPA